MRSAITIFLFLTVVTTAAAQVNGVAGRFTEYEIKAAFLYKFAQFIEWPEAFEADSTILRIGILGEDPFGDAIDDVVEGKRVKSRWVRVVRYLDIHEVEKCHVLFVSESENRWLPQIIDTAKQKHVLTVGETEPFFESGGVIRLLTSGKKVRFAINQKSAHESGLKISSRLLKLAVNLRYTYSDDD